MKSLLKLNLIFFLSIFNSAYAANPILGWYGGLILGGSYAPKVDTAYDLGYLDTTTGVITITPVTGKLDYAGLGDIGGLVGYRWERFRAEGEFLYIYNPYQTIKLADLSITSPTTSSTYRQEGSTSTGAFFLNGYYDIYTPGCDADLIPYIGAGVGYAYVNNSVKFYYNNIDVPNTDVTINTWAPAGQLILGFSYFLDDFTSFSLDYRYITAAKKVRYVLPDGITTADGTTIYKNPDVTPPVFPATQQTFDSRFQMHTLNLTFSGAFKCFF